MSENNIVVMALCNSNMPKFLDNDLPIFKELVKDFFQDSVEPDLSENTLLKPLIQIMHNLQLSST